MRSRQFRLVGVAVVCIGAAGALLLATDIIGRVARWDVSAFLGLRVLGGHPLLNGLAHHVVHLADPLPTVVMLALICAAGVVMGRLRHAAAAALLVGGAEVAGLALKALLAHPRYQALLGPQRLSADSFPSGHSTTAMSIALAAVLVTPRRWRLFAALGGACSALATGISLVILGLHYPSDALGGFLLAGCFGLLAVAALRATSSDSQTGAISAWPFARLSGAAGGALGLAICAVALGGLIVMLTRADELISYAAVHTSAVVAAIAIAAASVGLVYALTAELETR